MDKMSSQSLMSITFPQCCFMVQSHDEKELIQIAKKHAKNHNMKMTNKQIKSMIQLCK